MNTKYVTSVLVGGLIILVDFLFYKGTKWFVPGIALAIIIAWMPYWMGIILRNKIEKEIDSKFPEFVRNLIGSIKSGMPISKAVLHVSNVEYGALSPYVNKLAHKIEWNIPVHKALMSFAEETKSRIIKRAIVSVIQAEKAGGNIEDVLEDITSSLIEIKRIKEQRKAGLYSQIVQSYVIFFVFLGVMVVIQNFLIPYLSSIQTASTAAEQSILAIPGVPVASKIDFSSMGSLASSAAVWFSSLQGIFLMLALIQGLFAGLVLGKLSEGDVVSGVKHSIVMMTVAFFIMTLARGAV